MILLTPSIAPPPSSHANDDMHVQATTTATLQPQAASTSVVARTESSVTQEEVIRRRDMQIPTVILDAQSVTHPMAAALATSLLGHVLFLKNQIPL